MGKQVRNIKNHSGDSISYCHSKKKESMKMKGRKTTSTTLTTGNSKVLKESIVI